MGHVRLGRLPRTRRWDQVVGLVRAGASAAQVAQAALAAADRGLAAAAHDTGVVEALFLLVRLPLAARADDFPAAAGAIGLDLPAGPGLLDVVGAASDALDAATPNARGRTDLGEMAQAALAEALVQVVGGHLRNNLFDTGPDDVRRAFARHATVVQFGVLARDFFARFAARALDYHLSRTLPDHVGDGERFRTLEQQAEFTDALRTHCREAAAVVERFAGEWLSKANWLSGGNIDRAAAGRFAHGAMAKLTAELRQGGVG